MRRAALLCGVMAMAACRKDPPPPAAESVPSASASAPRGVSDFPEDPDAPRPPRSLGPAPSGSAVTRESREKAVLDLLAGKLPAAEVAEESTDPGREFDSRLRYGLSHQLRRGEVRLDAVTATGIGVDAVTRAVKAHLGLAHACYRRGLRLNPHLGGRVVLMLTIGAEGEVSEAAQGGSDVPDSWVIRCVAARFKGISMGKPDAAPASARVPIVMSPGE